MSPQLDPAQAAVAAAAPSTRQLVSAGPGAGKTQTIAELVAQLIDDHGVDSASELVVVSFSNAATQAVDERLRSHGLPSVTVQTLDSLASEAIADLSQIDTSAMSFDQRIALASKLVRAESWDRLNTLRHVIVDEVQDIVGIRAEFLIAIVESLPEHAGFSMLGDLAQGIYDFQLRAEKASSSTTAQELALHLTKLHGVQQLTLTEQYRAKTRETVAAAALRRSALNSDNGAALDRFVATLTQIPSLEAAAGVAKNWRGKTAFLTATNGQALLVARALGEAGHEVELRRAAQQRVVASWVARLLADVATRDIRPDEFLTRAAEREPHADGPAMWRGLRAAAPSRGADVDLRRLVMRLGSPRALPPVLLDRREGGFVVSTVHRAKGLEFENVVLVDFESKTLLSREGDLGERRRTLFVAVTRARSRMARATGPSDRWIFRDNRWATASHRWYVGGPKHWMTHGFEIRVDDFEKPEASASQIALARQHLSTSIEAGDQLEMTLDVQRSSLELPVYAVSHGGVLVAHTTAGFGEDLAARLGSGAKRSIPWPRLEGARVESVATQIAPARIAAGTSGLYLVPVSAGLMQLDWKGHSK